MTAARLLECLAALRWSKRALAEMVGRDEKQVRRWAAGESPVPQHVAEWLEALARCHARHQWAGRF